MTTRNKTNDEHMSVVDGIGDAPANSRYTVEMISVDIMKYGCVVAISGGRIFSRSISGDALGAEDK